MLELISTKRKQQKCHDPTYSKEKHEVAAITDGEYYTPGYHKQRLWNRHELLLV